MSKTNIYIQNAFEKLVSFWSLQAAKRCVVDFIGIMSSRRMTGLMLTKVLNIYIYTLKLKDINTQRGMDEKHEAKHSPFSLGKFD